jgi:regulator of cell morphogenesis and NO signaling
MTDATTTLPELAVAHPAADAALDDIRREEARAEPSTRWALAPMSALADHIVSHHHLRLRESLPNLVAMARKIEAQHGDTSTTCPVGLAALLEELHRSILDHLEKEETFVFPAILRPTGAWLRAPIYVVELEHEHHKSELLRIRALTSNLTPPADASYTWLALYLGLQDLEQELMDDIHLENDILLRRALEASSHAP